MRQFISFVTVSFLFMIVSMASQGADTHPSGKATGELWGGAGWLSGDVTYQIGYRGEYFPLSELKWPVHVTFGKVGGSLNMDRLELLGQVSKNIDEDAGTMEDSDWEDVWNPDLKTTYSESDTDFDGYTADATLRYWLMEKKVKMLKDTKVSLAVGGGYLYQNYRWDAKNVDQWYPQNPNIAHDLVAGLAGTYESTLKMPYMEAAGKLVFGRLAAAASAGYAPSARLDDEDDHKLRYIRADTEADGTAFKASVQVRYRVTDNFFALAQADYLTFDTDGTENNLVYAGPDAGDRWSIDHAIESSQTSFLVAAGLNF
jgi:outer membrane protease